MHVLLGSILGETCPLHILVFTSLSQTSGISKTEETLTISPSLDKQGTENPGCPTQVQVPLHQFKLVLISEKMITTVYWSPVLSAFLASHCLFLVTTVWRGSYHPSFKVRDVEEAVGVRGSWVMGQRFEFRMQHPQSTCSFFFSFVFLPFFGPLLQHMEVPRLGVELEL